MLPERHLRLLTAYVDGELSDRQRRLAERLLRESEEARALLAQFQSDSQQLIELPPVHAPVDLTRNVMDAVAGVKRRPVPRPRPIAPPRAFPAWTGWAAAAAVLLLVGLWAFWQHRQVNTDDGVANRGGDIKQPVVPDPKIVKVTPKPQTPKEDDRKPPPAPEEDRPRPTPEKPDDPPISPSPMDTDKGKPKPEKPDDPVFTDGSREPFNKFERVELAVPEVHRLHGLDKAENSRKLREQLTTGTSFRVELPSRDAGRGFDHVKAALAARKVTLVIDPTAAALLKKPKARPSYALFIENISPADLLDLLTAFGAADRAAADKKASDQRFDGSLVVKGLSRWDQKEFADLLGVDVSRVRPAPPKSVGVDVRKPISDQTAAEVADILEGKRAPRPGTTLSAQSALVLPLSGTRARSAEVKRFLDSRKPAREGTLQVFIVLRSL